MLGAKSWMTMTVLPPRCAFSRRRTTRPYLEGLGMVAGWGCDGDGVVSPAGRPVESSAANGLFRPAPVGLRSSFCFLAMDRYFEARLARAKLEDSERVRTSMGSRSLRPSNKPCEKLLNHEPSARRVRSR